MNRGLTLDNISAGYGQQAVVRGITATCPRGTITCLLGSNGAGKTTLLRAVSGFIRPRAGGITLNGVELSTLSFRDRARYIASVPQLAQDSLPLTVREAVRMARYPYLNRRLVNGGDVFAAVDTAISAMGLNSLADRPCAELSGGEWRKVLIAQGLAQETPVVLLDEPTAFLDPPARRQILSRMIELAAERDLVVIAVLHDLDLAAQYAGHALLLRDGELLAAGDPSAVLSTAQLAELYGCGPEWLGPEVVAHA